MALHAVVDFPFYIPACVVLYGIGIGMLETSLSIPGILVTLGGSIRRIVLFVIGAVAFWLIGGSVGAEAAARFALHQWQRAHLESAAYWFQVAQRLQPRDWRYHWQAANFWMARAEVSNSAAAARLADRAYAAAYDANPREAFTLVGRIVLHRTLRVLLDAPADGATLQTWARRAVELAPANRAALREREFVSREFAPPRRDGQNGDLMKQGRRHGAS
jgi:hypothetical protein